ncbi:MAG: hypothetical protein QW156_04460 [Candidatus Aenigmatarchaeota archaeon]
MDKETVGANYIMLFYNEVENLNDRTADYLNYINSKSSEQLKIEKDSLEEKVNFLRFLIRKIMIRFLAIKSVVKELGNYESVLSELYLKIMRDEEGGGKLKLIDGKDLFDYTVNLNKVIVETVVGELILKSSDILRAFGGK